MKSLEIDCHRQVSSLNQHFAILPPTNLFIMEQHDTTNQSK